MCTFPPEFVLTFTYAGRMAPQAFLFITPHSLLGLKALNNNNLTQWCSGRKDLHMVHLSGISFHWLELYLFDIFICTDQTFDLIFIPTWCIPCQLCSDLDMTTQEISYVSCKFTWGFYFFLFCQNALAYKKKKTPEVFAAPCRVSFVAH